MHCMAESRFVQFKLSLNNSLIDSNDNAIYMYINICLYIRCLYICLLYDVYILYHCCIQSFNIASPKQ
jgi:hypothetical protein